MLWNAGISWQCLLNDHYDKRVASLSCHKCANGSWLKSAVMFLQAWTGEASLGDALLSTFQRLPHIRWMATTLGSRGSVFLGQAEALQNGDSIPTIRLDDVLDQLSEQMRESKADLHDEPPACTTASGVDIRCALQSFAPYMCISFMSLANAMPRSFSELLAPPHTCD